jgi:hypothetical protein
MGIDGIGKKGPLAPPAPAPAGGSPRAHEAGRGFEVRQPGRPAPPATAVPVDAARTPLDRLRAGEIDVEGYVDAKMTEATAHLGPLPAARLAEIREALRDRMVSDPTLADLLRTAAGNVPAPPGDD